MSQANPFDAILAQSRDLFCDRLGAAVHGMLEHANEILSALVEKTDDEQLQLLYIEARDKAFPQRALIEKQFRTRYLAEFQKVANRARKLGTSLSDFSLDQLELVGDDDLNETLKFKDMAAKVRRYCDEELGALDQRVGVLLGDANLEADDNPFGPQVIGDAYKQACRQVDESVAVRMVLLKLFDDHVLDTIRSSYKAVNELLVQEGILPKIRYAVSKSEASARPPGEKAPEKEKEKAPGAKAEAAAEGDVFAMIQKMLGPVLAQGGGGGPGMGVGGAPLVEGQALMGSLTQLQVGDMSAVQAPDAEQLAALVAAAQAGTSNVLRELKSTSVGAGMGQVDAMTLDIVAMLFDEIFDDPKVPIAVKGLIGRLQLPVLKVAIADKELFTKKAHPARQLIDALGKLGMRLPTDFDASMPLFGKLESFVQELVDGFQEKMEIFDGVRARLDEIIEEYDAHVALEMQESAKQLERAESLAVAKAAAQEEIRKRVKGSTAPRPIVEFLSQQWIKYLLVAHAREGVESGSWKAGLETIDDLLWSIEPKTTIEDRRKLASTIPRLLQRLRAGLGMAGVNAEESSAFFGELMKCHTDVMQPPVKERTRPSKKGAPPPPPPPPPPPADEFLDFTAPVVVTNPFGEGQVEVATQDLDFSAAPSSAPALEAADPDASIGSSRKQKARDTIPLPARLVVGAWVQILQDTGEPKAAQLHYVSPMKSHFLFVDRRGQKVYECSRSMLKRRLDNFEISILDGEPDASLFDRILNSLFGKLGTPVPA